MVRRSRTALSCFIYILSICCDQGSTSPSRAACRSSSVRRLLSHSCSAFSRSNASRWSYTQGSRPAFGGPVRSPAIVIDQPIVRHPIKMGRESGADRIVVAPADHVHPDILEQFLGRRRITALPRKEPLEASLMAALKFVERAGIAIAVAKHQLCVAAVGAPGHSGLPACANRPARATRAAQRSPRRIRWALLPVNADRGGTGPAIA